MKCIEFKLNGENIQYDLTNNPSITISLKGDIINSLRGVLEKIDEFKTTVQYA